ncbi:MAG: helix-turn-helix domain-containing protein, partial [Clostridia bacterium]|nr:helix-turn-helix domain-containing protein [Clostridia bacterium]
FRARFKQFSGGLSPSEYRNRLRVRKAQELLSSSLWTTDLIAETLGFYDTSHFYRIYKKYTGKTPKQAEHAGKELP